MQLGKMQVADENGCLDVSSFFIPGDAFAERMNRRWKMGLCARRPSKQGFVMVLCVELLRSGRSNAFALHSWRAEDGRIS